jgi:hypothetical protein
VSLSERANLGSWCRKESFGVGRKTECEFWNYLILKGIELWFLEGSLRKLLPAPICPYNLKGLRDLCLFWCRKTPLAKLFLELNKIIKKIQYESFISLFIGTK